ncbi:MAG: N-6 DNA methylase [Gammaproteobacteria bacterium]|nr:N-6 DNA methylase [Gammaproteobacteria bacterium]
MRTLRQSYSVRRYHTVTQEKADGATYTPKILADFVARSILEIAGKFPTDYRLSIFDPAVGSGELLISLLEGLDNQSNLTIEAHGFETNQVALDTAVRRINKKFPNVSQHFMSENFLEHIFERFNFSDLKNCSKSIAPKTYDLIIANPPYVRTQIMGTEQAQRLAKQFNLAGRVDLYHAFVLGISRILNPNGVAGIIVSNRFMTTKSGSSVRQGILDNLSIRHVWDLGDTKLFNAAVLPAVILAKHKNSAKIKTPAFTSIYQSTEAAQELTADPVSALDKEGVIEVNDGRRFNVRHGRLDTGGVPGGIWRIATKDADTWLETVYAHSWGTFRDIG